MAGYIKNTIDFDGIQKDLDAAKALESAGKIDMAKDVLKQMSDKIIEEDK